jgi:hypothetical protein
MNRILILTVLLFATGLAHAQDIVGDWEGTLQAGGAELRLVLHITKAPDNTLKATLDSIDQPGANGIPVSSISLKDSKLNLGIDAIHDTYEGKVSSDAQTITGTWTQATPLPLEFKRTITPIKTEHKPAKPSDIDGAWLGSLDAGAVKLRVVFHIVNTEDGLTATLDSPDQGMKGLPTTSATRTSDALKIEVKSLAGLFEGKIASDLSSIDGKWTQGGATLPLLLKPVKNESELDSTPAESRQALSLSREEVSYPNSQQNVTLAATLTIPQAKGPSCRRAHHRLRPAGSR